MSEPMLNGDLSRRVTVASASMPWSPSPSPSVWRKRLHRVGPAESGQVTSVVRYDPNSVFPAHEHPDGEEILVLEGVFTDDRGDWPAGTFLLNPEGYRHAPSSRDGCVIFVKLRQFPGRDRRQVAVNTADLPWQQTATGSERKVLYEQSGYRDSMAIERWPAGFGPRHLTYPDGAELFVLDGEFSDESGRYETGTWLRFPPDDAHTPQSATGCTLYIKIGGQHYLQAG